MSSAMAPIADQPVEPTTAAIAPNAPIGATHITIVNRGVERGEALTDLLNGKVKEQTGNVLQAEFLPWDQDFKISEKVDAAINATSIGLFPDVDAQLAIDFTTLRQGMVVADVIPNPPRTHLVKTAESAGCRVIDGLGMLVAQGVIGIEYWTGQTPDANVMRRGLEEVFGEG